MMLLVLAGLFVQSLANLARADLGMNVDSVVTFTVSPRRNGYSDAQAMQFYASARARAREPARRHGRGVVDGAVDCVVATGAAT